MAQLKVTQRRSTIGNKRSARESVRSLGLRKIHQSVVVEDNPVNRGYIRAATHLLAVEQLGDADGQAPASGSAGSGESQ